MTDENGAQAKRGTTPFRDYTIVRVDGSTLTVVKEAEPGRRQEEACDKYVKSLPEDERKGTFAAFLASSYREFAYETTTRPVTSKAARTPSFAHSVSASEPAGVA